MLAIIRKALADLCVYRLPSALLFVIILAATATLTLALTLQRSADNAWERTFAEANGAHVSFYAAADADISALPDLAGVTASDGPFPIVWGASLAVGGDKYDAVLYGMRDLPAINRPLITDGRWLQAGDTRGIVVDRSFARALDIAIGDSIGIPTPSGVQQFGVVGLAINPGRGPYPQWSTTGAWVLPETLRVVESDAAERFQFAFVQLADPRSVDAFIPRAYAAIPALSAYGADTWQEVRSGVNQWNQLMTVFLTVFALFSLAAVAFIVANAIGGRVLAQFREIGLLKAVGFTPGQVAMVFLVQNVLLALVAGGIGIAIGVLLAPLFLRRTEGIVNASTGLSLYPALAIGVLLGIVALVALFTILPAWRGGRISTVQAIRTGFEPPQRKPSLPARFAAWLRLPLVVVMGVKDSFSRPLRAILTIVALMMTVLTVTFALSLEATARKILDNPAMNGEPYDMSVTRHALSYAEASAVIAANPDVTAIHTRDWVRAHLPETNGEAISFGVRVLDGDYRAFPYAISAGRMIDGPGEAVAGIGLFKLLGLKVGDNLTVLVDGQPVTLQVVGRVIENDDDGQLAFVDAETLRPFFPDAQPSQFLLLLDPAADTAAVTQALYAASNYDLSIDVTRGETPEEATTIRTVMLGLSLVLLVIGMANLLSTTLLNVRERVRDFAIVKAIGMTPRQITAAVISGVSLQALVAVVLGIPLGLWVYDIIFRNVAENEMGADPLLYTRPEWWWLALLVPGAIILSALASAIPAHRATRVAPAEVLRYE